MRRRSSPGAGGALCQPDELCPLFRDAGERGRGAASPTARSGPTSSTIVANRRAHYETTGPEIWDQTDGKVDAFVASVGTGGTLAGIGMALKERNKTCKIYLADPMGSAIYGYYAHGELKAEGNSITEGIGQGRITKNLEGAPIDGWFQVTDEEMLPVLFDLVIEEGLILGGSTGINILGAIKAAKELGPGHTIVTILADYGTRYQSKLFNPAFLRERKLPVPKWLEGGPA